MSFDHSSDNGAQKICDKYYPSLYLDGIDTVPIEKVQWKILFQLLIERLYGPSPPIDFFYISDREFKVVGQKRNRLMRIAAPQLNLP